MSSTERLLIFGARGAIGAHLFEHFSRLGWEVFGTARLPAQHNGNALIPVDPFAADWNPSVLNASGPYSAVIWAQGSNHNDSIRDVAVDAHLDLYRANCLFIVATLRALLDQRLLRTGARLCVVSSIWQEIGRPGKFSYSVTKSALHGLVTAVAADLANDQIVINAVLPGALDTPMTRANLNPDQLDRMEKATDFGRLPRLAEVAHAVEMLCSPANSGVTGQFLAVDLGFSHVKKL